MALSNVSPSSGSVVETGETFIFTNDDTVSTVSTIEVIDLSGTPVSDTVFITPTYQAGYTGITSVDGTDTTFQFSADAGISGSPFQIQVTLVDLTVFTLSYTLRKEVDFPTFMTPFNPIEGVLGAFETKDEGLQVVATTDTLNFVGDGVTVIESPANTALITIPGGGGGGSDIAVEDEGVPLTAAVTKFNFAGGGVTATEPVADEILVTIPDDPIEVEIDGVSATTAVTKFNFVGPVGFASEPVANEIELEVGARLHSLTDTFGGNVMMLWQGDNTNTDETSNHTLGTQGSVEYGIGHVPGFRAGYCTEGNGNWWSTAVAQSGGGETTHRRGTGEAVSGYALIYHDPNNGNSTPYYFMSGVGGAGSTINYALVLVGEELNYQNSGSGGTINSAVRVPRMVWTHIGFTRDASDNVTIYMNGVEVKASTNSPNVPTAAGDFYIGSAGIAANGYAQFGYIQSLKVVNVELTAAEMLQEAQRTLGR